jgi:type IV pilus assembly protein PilC
MRLMAASSDHLRVRAICRAMGRDLASGKPLREAVGRHEGRLPRFFTLMLASAERSGTYDDVLRTLQRHYAWLTEVKGEILKAVSYPLAVLLLGKVVFWIRDFVLHEVIQSGEMVMPGSPIAGLSGWFWYHFEPVLWAIVVAYGLTTLLREVRGLRVCVDTVGLMLPWVGSLVKRYAVANFCRMYATLTEAGLHPSTVYVDAASSMGNIPLERRIVAWKRFVDDGEPVSAALRRSGVMPADVLALVETSEEAASVGESLPRLADLMTDQIRHEMRALVRAFTPFAPFVIALAFFGPALLAFSPLFALVGIVHPWDVMIFLFFFLLFLI